MYNNIKKKKKWIIIWSVNSFPLSVVRSTYTAIRYINSFPARLSVQRPQLLDMHGSRLQKTEKQKQYNSCPNASLLWMNVFDTVYYEWMNTFSQSRHRSIKIKTTNPIYIVRIFTIESYDHSIQSNHCWKYYSLITVCNLIHSFSLWPPPNLIFAETNNQTIIHTL